MTESAHLCRFSENGKLTHNFVEQNLVRETVLLPPGYIKCIGAGSINFTPGVVRVYTVPATGVVLVDIVLCCTAVQYCAIHSWCGNGGHATSVH